jgi:hypothetical protein
MTIDSKKIKELAKQVDGWNCNGVFVGPYHKSMEKFAELIVKECANEIIEMADKYATFNGDIRRHIVHGAISEKLKEHFGVK